MPNLRSEDISDVFTHDGIQRLKRNQLLRFNYEGTIIEFIITYINKEKLIVRGRRTTTLTSTEALLKIQEMEDAKKTTD